MATSAIINLPSDHSGFSKIYGLTILERTLQALNRAEVEKVFVISGSEENDVSNLVNNTQFLNAFQVENTTLKNALSEIKTPFFYIAQPLVTDPNIFREMMAEGMESNLPVLTENQEVIFISNPKHIPSESDFSNLKLWAEKDQFPKRIKSVENRVFGVVTDKISKRQIEKKLIKSLIKPTDGWVSKNLNRPISISISRVLAHTSITPNQFTVFTGLIGLATGYFFTLGGYWNYMIGGLLFHLTSVFDGVDGELARLKFKSSPFGQWLDTLVDNLSYVAALAGIVYGVYVHGASDFVKISGILAVVFAVSALASLYFYLLRFKAGGTLLNVEYSFQKGNSTFAKVMRVAALFGKRDLFALIFFGLGLIGQMPLALTYVAIMAFFVFAFSIQAHLSGSKKN